ncbi:methylthioadenosine phosphorylase [Methanohalobium evestigatum Z-7303]|uniref:S-methyl-5'-thioadenosine phosphorylase n=1 Tax=Methanohalobium evestigatum (strain ATCC BAA-1072 / DSM 3721 / NBRC 107634 / OCM 161 / Z-7303) TaxID=644295 RepID=D7EB10_METEZ|nr:S-methyl-5'-thioadenosine phosphorylase [Methanohalobium evestigatum]ADI74527.1 methylthioadenosine phosphorylase [Methanohalobium evestigatum Z-7303]
MDEKADIAIIGGSGIYDLSWFDNVRQVDIDTPFGKPSDEITIGEYGDRTVCFLPRHDAGHRISPTQLNSRANIFALKKLGVKRIISASAVGSLKNEISPLDLVIPNQIYDRTKSRTSTFFEEGIVVHAGFADPFCPELSETITDIARSKGYNVHDSGTYVCIEGPQFSTRAESSVYQSLGFDVIGMTALPEVKLAREAEICYTMIATVTDYDVWKEQDVDIATVIENTRKNVNAVKDIVSDAIEKIPLERDCVCKNALEGAIITNHNMVPYDTKRKLEPLIGKYLEE